MLRNEIAPSLELEQDPVAQQREWRFERAGWWLIALLIVAGLAGLFGDGGFARRTARSPTPGATATYERIVRAGASSTLLFTVDASSPADTMVELALDRAYVATMDIDRVTPEPVETRASSTWVVYRFRRAEPGRPATIDFALSPRAVGRHSARIATAFGQLQLAQLALP